MLRAGSRIIWASPEAARREVSTASARNYNLFNKTEGPLRSLQSVATIASVEESSTASASGRRFQIAIKRRHSQRNEQLESGEKNLNLVLERRGRTPRGGAWGSDSTLRFCRNRRGGHHGVVPGSQLARGGAKLQNQLRFKWCFSRRATGNSFRIRQSHCRI